MTITPCPTRTLARPSPLRIGTALDHPLDADQAIAARLPAPLHPAWQAWLRAPRVRLLDRVGPFGRGVIALAPARDAEDGCRADLDPALTGRRLTIRVFDKLGRVCEVGVADSAQAPLADALGHLDDAALARRLASHLDEDGLQPVFSDEQAPWPALRHAIPQVNAAVELLFLTPEGHFEPGARGRLLPALRERERWLQDMAGRHLAQGLDPSVLGCLRTAGLAPTLAHYNWLAGMSPTLQARRLHALLTAPRFCRAFLAGDAARRGAFEAAVAAGVPLRVFLESHYRLPVVGLQDADPPDHSGGQAPRRPAPLRRQG